MKQLDIPGIFRSDAQDLIKARDDARRIHGSDIRAAGNEVEQSVREYFRRMLPAKYYVTHGHLVDMNGSVSPQLDLIVADNFTLPSLMTTKDGTEYVPIETVYAIGEVKSTYYKSHKYIEGFSDTLQDIRTNLHREEIPNTTYGGITHETLLRDMVLARGGRVLNRLFAFMFFIDAGDFAFAHAGKLFGERDRRYLPNVSALMNQGIVVRGRLDGDQFAINRYPEDPQHDQEEWFFSPYPGDESGSLAGNHLGFEYYSLLEHLNNSFVEPPSLWKYMTKMMIGRKSMLERIHGS